MAWLHRWARGLLLGLHRWQWRWLQELVRLGHRLRAQDLAQRVLVLVQGLGLEPGQRRRQQRRVHRLGRCSVCGSWFAFSGGKLGL
jgi:hypothetical protein